MSLSYNTKAFIRDIKMLFMEFMDVVTVKNVIAQNMKEIMNTFTSKPF